jgi:nucleoside 2-deoxyribosyltransferase
MDNKRSIKLIYLAGPDVFYPDAIALGEKKKALCKQYGFEGLYPLDNEITHDSQKVMSTSIYKGNLDFMERADAIVANISPFRGPNMDPGTAFEIGYFAAQKKPVFLYTNHSTDYRQRVHPTNSVDERGNHIEDFGEADNLMIINATPIRVARPDQTLAPSSCAALEMLLQAIVRFG